MENIFRKYYHLVFLGIALVLLYPTFGQGYIFLLDWLVRPNIFLADINWALDPITSIIFKLAEVVFSFAVFQRIFFFFTIYLLGISGFRLAKRTGNIFAQYFAGIFFIFNPFIYARLIEQPGIALGSALFFWFLIFLLEYLEEKKIKKLVLASVCAGLAVSIFAHSIFFVGLLAFSLLFFDYLKTKNWKFFLKTLFLIFGIIIVLNANWLFSFSKGGSSGAGSIASFNLSDTQAFRTRGLDGDNVYLTVLALQGYWGEYQDRFVSIRENPFWRLAFGAIFLLAIFGLFKQWKRDCFAKPLALSALVAYFLAIGIASPIFKPIVVFLYNYMPLYIGLRESQKWVIVLVFVYAYFASWGIKHLLEIKIIKNYQKEVGIFCAILPIIFVFSIIRGMHQHLTPHNFPIEWQQAKNKLSQNEKILFFPWHLYANLDFAGKNVAVPAQSFFGKNIIQANNTEFGGVYSHSQDRLTLAIEKYVIKKDNPIENMQIENFREDMKRIGIETVMLAKTEDWREYLWLDTIGMRKVLENDKLIIYNLQ